MKSNHPKDLTIAIDGMLLRQGVSGVETAIYSLAQAAGRYGKYHYTLFLPEASPLPDLGTENLNTLRCTVPCGSRLMRIIHQHIVLPRRVRKAGCDVLHCPGYLSPRWTGVPVVLTVHDLIAFSHPELCRKATVINYKSQMPRAIRTAARLIVPSRSTYEQLAERFPAAKNKTRIVPFGIDSIFTPEKADGEQQTIRAKYNLPEKFILFVGQIEPKKNVPGLIHAYSQLWQSGWHHHGLVIAGRRGWERQDPGALAARLGLEKNIVVTGFVPRADLPALYRAADLFVFPSICEGFGLPPLEAMACGTPVIVSDRDSLPQTTHGCTPAVSPEDCNALAAAMRRLLADKTYAAAVANRCLERAATFSWQHHVETMEPVYCELANGAGRTGSIS